MEFYLINFLASKAAVPANPVGIPLHSSLSPGVPTSIQVCYASENYWAEWTVPNKRGNKVVRIVFPACEVALLSIVPAGWQDIFGITEKRLFHKRAWCAQQLRSTAAHFIQFPGTDTTATRKLRDIIFLSRCQRYCCTALTTCQMMRPP